MDHSLLRSLGTPSHPDLQPPALLQESRGYRAAGTPLFTLASKLRLPSTLQPPSVNQTPPNRQPQTRLGKGSSSGKSIEKTTKEIQEHYDKVQPLHLKPYAPTKPKIQGLNSHGLGVEKLVAVHIEDQKAVAWKRSRFGD